MAPPDKPTKPTPVKHPWAHALAVEDAVHAAVSQAMTQLVPVREQGTAVPARGSAPPRRALLAVSGGPDSMVLLHAAAVVAPSRRLIVATYDHGTGPSATRAAELVAAEAGRLGIECVVGSAAVPGRTEAEWRHQRWQFLRDTAARATATVLTAHTRDDHIETVFIRILRDAGPRGLAALYAPSSVLRPFLGLPRATIHAYAAEKHITFMTDPSNADRRHLRNRVRLDLLPAILARHPTFGDDLLAFARRAADWRARIDGIAATFTVMLDTTGTYIIPRHQLQGYSATALRTLWPALAARAGVVMDRRGTHRLALFTIEGETGQSIQLSGGIDVRMRRDALVLHHSHGLLATSRSGAQRSVAPRDLPDV